MISKGSVAIVLTPDVRARVVAASGSNFVCPTGADPAATTKLVSISGPHGTGVVDGFTVNASWSISRGCHLTCGKIGPNLGVIPHLTSNFFTVKFSVARSTTTRDTPPLRPDSCCTADWPAASSSINLSSCRCCEYLSDTSSECEPPKHSRHSRRFQHRTISKVQTVRSH